MVRLGGCFIKIPNFFHQNLKKTKISNIFDVVEYFKFK